MRRLKRKAAATASIASSLISTGNEAKCPCGAPLPNGYAVVQGSVVPYVLPPESFALYVRCFECGEVSELTAARRGK